MTKNLAYIIGSFLVCIGFIFKSLFNHNLDHWVLLKYFCLLSIALGLSAILVPIEEELLKKKKSAKASRAGGNTFRVTTFLTVLILTLGLEKLGEIANYQLRTYYLNQSVVQTNGTIDSMKRIDLSKVGNEDFYLVNFEIDGKAVQKGLIVDYAQKDGYKIVDQITRVDESLFVPIVKGRTVQIIYSDKFPSFFKIKNEQ